MDQLKKNLKYLSMNNLLENIDEYLSNAEKDNISIVQFLKNIFQKETEYKKERARLYRVDKSKIPMIYNIENYPFERQIHLNKKRLLDRYDSLDYLKDNRNIIFIGPTGAGKTGLATCFLLHAINNGYNGLFISFQKLMDNLYKSEADGSGNEIIAKYARIDCLLIDELGYIEANKTQVGLFFSLMQQRHKKKCTLMTSNLGFKDWSDFLQNKHLTAALIDRITDNGHVINMKNCESIRPKPDID